MAEQDPGELSEQLERETDELARDSRKVKDSVAQTREDWEHKRTDESVPGAPPPEGDEEKDEDDPDEAEDKEDDDPGEADDA